MAQPAPPNAPRQGPRPNPRPKQCPTARPTPHYEIDDPTVQPTFWQKWGPSVWLGLFLYFMACFAVLNELPNSIWDPDLMQMTIVIGVLGIWRYGWWSTHAIRAVIYGRFVYPKLRAKADQLWAHQKPQHVHFMMTTYKEHRPVTEKVVISIISEIERMGIPATIWLGSGDRYDEDLMEQLLRQYAGHLDVEFVMIRQNQPGKRLAIGLVLRAMNRANIHKDDIVVFMDGDSIIGPDCVRRCASLFAADPDLQAVTTDEEVICYGPGWVRRWLTMRFAQRRIAMQSHALSKKVLTLTGRMSVFRAHHLLAYKFIRLLEADYLEDWIWGSFRFLSGDDKSTWYYMLTQNAKMLYAPDAMVYTVEYIEGSGFDRMVQNFRRWSGNMLRNGSRALKLGPHKVGFFIWWCVLDQRIAMWTMLVSPILATMASILHTPAYLVTYAVWIAVTRMLLSLVLYCFNRHVDLAYPAILYFNQLFNATVKVYILFRLSKQRWSNRGNQSAGIGGDSLIDRLRNALATYLTVYHVGLLALGTCLYAGLLELPSLAMVQAILLP